MWEFDDRAGAVLRSLRLAARLTQEDIAKRLGCSISHVSKVELGGQNVTVGEFLAWCEAVGVEPDAAIRFKL